jgi:hypothetical protein
MAAEADAVVVTLLAENAQFDAATKASAASYTQGMKQIETAGAGAERAHGRLTASVGNSRIAMMEFQHVARGMSDQLAAGASPTQALAMHVGMLGQAVSLAGGSFGKVGMFLSGPWGLALTVATTAVLSLVASHLKEEDSLDSTFDKLKKHKEQTELNARAEDIWAHSLDGLIERSKKLNDSLDKRLQTQTELQAKTLSQAQSDFAAALAAETRLQADPSASPAQLQKVQTAIRETSIALHNAQVLAAQDAGEAIASITKSAQVWADQQLHTIKVLQTAHPELAEKAAADEMLASYNQLKDAIGEAAAANIDFNGTVTDTNRLNLELEHGTITVAKYDQSIRSLAQSLRDAVKAARDAPKAIEDFKRSVIGAEGTGPNRMGSSAAGFGQFMPSTWEGYFKRLYPQQASGLSTGQIDALRSNREIANAVIDAATKDYVAVLKNAGQNITAAGLYTVHLLGAATPGSSSARPLALPPARSSAALSSAATRSSAEPPLTRAQLSPGGLGTARARFLPVPSPSRRRSRTRPRKKPNSKPPSSPSRIA